MAFRQVGWVTQKQPEILRLVVAEGQTEFALDCLVSRDATGDLRLEFSVNGQSGGVGAGWVLAEEAGQQTTLTWDGPYDLSADDEVTLTYTPR